MAILKEMGVALRDDTTVSGVFSPKNIPHLVNLNEGILIWYFHLCISCALQCRWKCVGGTSWATLQVQVNTKVSKVSLGLELVESTSHFMGTLMRMIYTSGIYLFIGYFRLTFRFENQIWKTLSCPNVCSIIWRSMTLHMLELRTYLPISFSVEKESIPVMLFSNTLPKITVMKVY